MQRVIASVLHSDGGSVIVDRSIGSVDADGNAVFPSEVQIAGATYGVDGCGGSENHEVWTPANREGEKSLPGWLRGYKITLSTSGVFKPGDKVSIEESVPEQTEAKVMGNVAPPPVIPPETDTAPGGVESPLDNPEEPE